MKGSNHNASTVLVQIGGCGRICCFMWRVCICVVNCSGECPHVPLPLGRGLVRGLLITRPHHHHLIALVLAHKAVAFFHRQRCLLAFTHRRMTGAELPRSCQWATVNACLPVTSCQFISERVPVADRSPSGRKDALIHRRNRSARFPVPAAVTQRRAGLLHGTDAYHGRR